MRLGGAMKEVIRKHVQYELSCLGENRSAVKEINQMIKEGEYTPTREYLSMLKRVVKIQSALLGCDGELKQVFVLRYKNKHFYFLNLFPFLPSLKILSFFYHLIVVDSNQNLC